MKARELAGQLQTAVSQQQMRNAEHLLDYIRTDGKKFKNFVGINSAAANAESFVIKERQFLTNFETTFSKLPTNFDGDPDASQINAVADQLTSTRAALNVLAPDLKAENEGRLLIRFATWR